MAHWCCLLLTCLLCIVPFGRSTADDLMDQYLSVPGAYVFVRRTPEGATSDRVRMTVFEDFLCPACYHTATELIPRLKAKYRDRLEVRFVCYPFIHPESRLPARAYVIAQEMGLGEQMQQALFHVHFQEQLNTASREGLARAAHQIGLDPDLLLARLDGDDGNATVDRNLALGESYRIDAVPGIILDGWIRVNTLSEENLVTIINGLLNIKERADGTREKNAHQGGPLHE